MTFNLGSLCMAILWNSIFIGIVFWIGKKKIYTTRKGIHLTLMFYLLGVVRMIFPIDFRPSIGIQVWKGVFPTVNYALSIQNYNLWGRQFTIADALVAIWLIIAGVFMLRYFVKYQEMRRIFQKYSTEANEQYQSVLSRITQEKKIKKKIAVYQNRGLLFLVRKVYSGGIFIFRTTIIRKKNYIMLCSMNVHISQMEICT